MVTEGTNAVAVYAAALSTIVAVWNFYQWWIKGPKLFGSTSSNMKAVGGGVPDHNTYTILTIKNRGDAPTTITHLGLFGYENRWKYLLSKPTRSAVINANGGMGDNTPSLLSPGCEFRGFAIQNVELEQWSHEHLLFMFVYHTMSNKPVRVRLKPIVNS